MSSNRRLDKTKSQTITNNLFGSGGTFWFLRGAKEEEGEESSLHNGRELSTHNLTSSAEPFSGTPLEGILATLNTGALSLQSSTNRTEYLFPMCLYKVTYSDKW